MGTVGVGTALSATAAGTTAISSGVNAYGQAQLAGQQRDLGKLQEAGQGVQAASALQEGAADALMAIQRRRAIQGQTEAQIGANGLNYGGSSADILNDINNKGAYEVNQIMRASDMNARALRLSGSQMRTSANLQAGQTQIGAFTGLVSGAANTMYMRSLTTPRPFIRPGMGQRQTNPLRNY